MHLRNFGRTIVPGEYRGMEYGPVQSELKDLMGLNTFNDPEDNELVKESFDVRGHDLYLKKNKKFQGFEKGIFSESEMMVLNQICEIFGEFGGWKLVDITHEYPEWKDSKHLLKNAGSFKMRLSRCFENPDQESLEIIKKSGFKKDPFEQSPEVLEYSKNKFEFRQMLESI
jgi:hypothetical protein